MNVNELSERQLYWEDLDVGEVFESQGRTITEADVINFACLSGDFNRLHFDANYAGQTRFGQRIAHGLLVVSVISGLSTRILLNQLIEKSILGLREIHCRFLRPTLLGDTIRARIEVLEKKETSKPDRGVVTFRRRAINQRDELMMEGDWMIVMRRRTE